MAALERGRVVAETILRVRPDDAAVGIDLARIHNRIGVLHKNAGRPEAALASYMLAYERLAALRREAPGNTRAEAELSVVCNRLGSVLRSLGRPDEARARYRECIDLNRDLARRSSDLQDPYALAISLGNYALLAYVADEREAAWAHLDEANKLLRDVVRDADPGMGRYRQGLAQNLYNRGCKLHDEKRYERAIVELREARKLLSRLVESQPLIPGYREDLARTLRQLGHAYRRLGDRDRTQFDAAIEAYQAAHKVNG
jgi:tetratricopeptide (TPR) repeat protein